MMISERGYIEVEEQSDRTPRYIISIAAQLVSVHPQTLRMYERVGLVNPQRRSNIRLYSDFDIARLRRVQRLINDLGVNLAGAEIIINMSEQIAEMRAEVEQLRRNIGAPTPPISRVLSSGER